MIELKPQELHDKLSHEMIVECELISRASVEGDFKLAIAGLMYVVAIQSVEIAELKVKLEESQA